MLREGLEITGRLAVGERGPVAVLGGTVLANTGDENASTVGGNESKHVQRDTETTGNSIKH